MWWQENNLINYVFKAFGLYFWGSVLLQTIFDYIDVNRSFKEFDYWRNITRSYISSTKFHEYKEQTIYKRFKELLGYYILIISLYIGIGYFCFNYQFFWEKTIQSSEMEYIEKSNNIPQHSLDSINILIEEKNDTIIWCKYKKLYGSFCWE